MKSAILFPGQGAQFAGMGKDFYRSFPSSRRLFDRAGEVLGFDLKVLCFDGPPEALNATDICQPAIFTTSLAILEAVQDEKASRGKGRELAPDAVAGLSLGEYTALVYAGVLSFEDGLRLVYRRGRLMQEACNKYPGGMTSLMGAVPEMARTLLKRVKGRGPLCIANLNCPGQVVLSGTLEALEEAEALSREVGVKKAIRLPVAGAFHSPLMREAAEGLVKSLKGVRFEEPRIPLYSNVTGTAVRDPEEIRDLLGRQVTRAVLWEFSMRNCLKEGIHRFIEPGPGRVLSGLLRKIEPHAECLSLDTVESVESERIGAK